MYIEREVKEMKGVGHQVRVPDYLGHVLFDKIRSISFGSINSHEHDVTGQRASEGRAPSGSFE